MKQKYLKLLKFLSERKGEATTGLQWTFEGMSTDDIDYLLQKEYISVQSGKNYSGYITNICLTQKGLEFIKSYCNVCECMPCDCDWGQP